LAGLFLLKAPGAPLPVLNDQYAVEEPLENVELNELNARICQ
jgi:hypothetical protein